MIKKILIFLIITIGFGISSTYATITTTCRNLQYGNQACMNVNDVDNTIDIYSVGDMGDPGYTVYTTNNLNSASLSNSSLSAYGISNWTIVNNGSIITSTILYSGQTHNFGTIYTIPAPADTTAPVLTLIGSGEITLEKGSAYTELYASWTDNVDGTGTLNSVYSGAVNVNTVGTYILQYRKTDSAGNYSNVVSRTVNIVDNTPPPENNNEELSNNTMTNLAINTASGSISEASSIVSLTAMGYMIIFIIAMMLITNVVFFIKKYNLRKNKKGAKL